MKITRTDPLTGLTYVECELTALDQMHRALKGLANGDHDAEMMRDVLGQLVAGPLLQNAADLSTQQPGVSIEGDPGLEELLGWVEEHRDGAKVIGGVLFGVDALEEVANEIRDRLGYPKAASRFKVAAVQQQLEQSTTGKGVRNGASGEPLKRPGQQQATRSVSSVDAGGDADDTTGKKRGEQ